ncbi:L-2-hydroxyglutarate dehydrogenase, mitochondrial [Vigna unguiculata]|uniref:L-2-hydroxyglutarate dehydrogenase, mitochondrial n=1 Tax=Vigna unguiculata TaxID=3917 RepID=A0A4D6LWP0_VIGUN|nr:L-2-hydroxyglutarate dehydrogenase, mitochondrial [Vigna unguiculata]XP_027924470.1 L-2-hydroxyglutarate dehydrogenase, mitochondrial [Vigna unguiculata]XP_027924471.1 L-2-hydroxyglutarate dehydrogenase, mitochondrial [Vigna unguiculata]QCD92778.1 D-amino-acid oxidase [Vigna unguiculata]
MLKQTVQRFEGCISASRRNGDVHMKWKKHLFGNWVRSMSSKPQSNDNRSTSYSVPKERVECVVIGAGVVGIAVARALALKGREVLVVESAPTFGTGTSSRSSEVIHAGIYYPANSFKAIFCKRGREMLYEYCSKHDIPHKQIGKLIVATRSSEIPKLCDILNRGIQNGVDGLKMVDGVDAMKMEPELQCMKAILSPVTGIVDSHSLMLSLVGEAENHGATFTYNSTVIGGHVEGNDICVHVTETERLKEWKGTSILHPELLLSSKLIVNSTGLSAPALAKRFSGLKSGVVPPSYYARGCYFTLSNTKASPFRHLIYPIPEDGGIGVHVTIDLNGQVKFGPNVEWIDSVDDISSFQNKFDYSVNPNHAERFYPEIRKYYPNLKDGSLEPGYSGIRPKLSGPSQLPADFVIQGEDIHGVPGLINLFGIESPGLTSSMAIAEFICTKFVG